MRLVSVRSGGRLVGAVELDRALVPLAAVAARLGLDPAAGDSVRGLLEHAGVGGLADVERAARGLAEAAPDELLALDGATLGPPVPDPQKIICLGLNYRAHIAEVGMELPAVPVFFTKFANTLAGPDETVVVPPAVSAQVDYEVELAVVIGARARQVEPAQALAHVAGAMAFNDLSARDLQFETSQWFWGKGADGFAPCGPALVTLDEVGSLDDLRLQTFVNGERVQDGTTADMIFDPATVIARLSTVLTLEPGDVIATGTPAGVGMSHSPPRYLHDGDRVEIEVERVGRVVTRMRFE